jgi:hypothetical protein
MGSFLKENSSPPGKLTCPRKLPACARQTGRYHTASNGSEFTDPVALPLRSPTPLWLTAWAYQRITTPCELSLRDGTAANQTLWF